LDRNETDPFGWLENIRNGALHAGSQYEPKAKKERKLEIANTLIPVTYNSEKTGKTKRSVLLPVRTLK